MIPAVAGLRFRLQTGRLQPDDDDARARRASGEEEVLPLLAEHLATRDFAAGSAYSVADIALYGYLHVAHEAGIRRAPHRCAPGSSGWRLQPRFMDDLEPYPANARPGAAVRPTTLPASRRAHANRRIGGRLPGHNAAGRSS